jgi:pimeloyl-ACP methyl ester carboxylesterase
VVGFSIGGLTGYELVISYPERVRRAVVASADHRNHRGGEADPARLPTPDDFQAMRDTYVATAPDPGAFDAVAERTSGLVQSFTGWTDDQLRDVRLPVLILVGDTDFIHVENAAETMRLLPQGQLAVLPGTTHMDLTRSTLLAPVIEAFLA